jgi:hypothetical protein
VRGIVECVLGDAMMIAVRRGGAWKFGAFGVNLTRGVAGERLF